MRNTVVVAILLALTTSLVAQTPLHGVYLDDIDKSANACTDFCQHANGAWRAANPIPASMDRWSRRWAAGEQNKNQLQTILDDESKRHDWPKASIDQQISDFYGSCMDETRINALGITPVKPLLDEIDSIKNGTRLQQTIPKLHDLQAFSPSGITAPPDNHTPSPV